MNNLYSPRELKIQLNQYILEAQKHMVAACANALKAGACLYQLSQRSQKSLNTIYNELNLTITRATLYRWVNAYLTACKCLGLSQPPLMSSGWDKHLADLEQLAQGMSINRLLLGAPAAGSDIARLDTLHTAVETSSPEDGDIYQQALENVESGKWTLIQALRAVGAQAAQELATERRSSPTYIGFDPETHRPIGIVPRAMTSLRAGFAAWHKLDGESKRAFASLWNELQGAAPSDLDKYL